MKRDARSGSPDGGTSGGRRSSAGIQRATGPRTEWGKKRSKQNALRHGIFAQVLLLDHEPRADFTCLLKGLREYLKPEGTLEAILVEKIAMLLWRQRRVIIAEVAEIRVASDFLEWDRELQQTEAAGQIAEAASAESRSELYFQTRRGLIPHIANPKILERCLALLGELQESVRANGFMPDQDRTILHTVYGFDEHVPRTVREQYEGWLAMASSSEDDRKQHNYTSPKDCVAFILDVIREEIKRLVRHEQTQSKINSARSSLEELRGLVPSSPTMERLLRYESSIERAFDRALNQLERLQRIRLGLPIPPAVKVDVSSS